jgi:hypothetical protein
MFGKDLADTSDDSSVVATWIHRRTTRRHLTASDDDSSNGSARSSKHSKKRHPSATSAKSDMADDNEESPVNALTVRPTDRRTHKKRSRAARSAKSHRSSPPDSDEERMHRAAWRCRLRLSQERRADSGSNTRTTTSSDEEATWNDTCAAAVPAPLTRFNATEESECATVPLAPAPSSQLTPVFLRRELSAAMPTDLFNRTKGNIRIDETYYKCSHADFVPGSKKSTIKKVYMCAMVRCEKGWVARPSYRANPRGSPAAEDTAPAKNDKGETPKEATKEVAVQTRSAVGKRTPKKKDDVLQVCQGKMVGHFRKNDYYFRIHMGAFHDCKLQHGGRQSDADSRPPFLAISAAPSWGITDTVLTEMKTALQTCPEDWWSPLPAQDYTRYWLRRIGEASTGPQKFMKDKIESLIATYFRFIQTMYPEMRYWKVGALRTQGGAPSQYEMWDYKLHRDYSHKVLKRPPNERPLSVIVALDDFSFYREPAFPDTVDGTSVKYEEITVHRGQAIAFTSALLHAGGPNNSREPIYRLFAYMVSNAGDFPVGRVYPDTIRRRDYASAALLHDETVKCTTVSGRTRQPVKPYQPGGS